MISPRNSEPTELICTDRSFRSYIPRFGTPLGVYSVHKSMYCRFVLFLHNFLTKVLTEVVAAFKAWRWIPLPLLGRILQIPIFAKGYFCLAVSMHIVKLTCTCSTSFLCFEISFVPRDSITFSQNQPQLHCLNCLVDFVHCQVLFLTQTSYEC